MSLPTNRKPLLHEQVSEDIINSIKNGTAPWLKNDSENQNNKVHEPLINALTGEPVQAINAFALETFQDSLKSDDPRFLTRTQADRLGATIKDGEKGCVISVWKTDEEKPIVYQIEVFNAIQCENMPPLPPKGDTVFRMEDLIDTVNLIDDTGGGLPETKTTQFIKQLDQNREDYYLLTSYNLCERQFKKEAESGNLDNSVDIDAGKDSPEHARAALRIALSHYLLSSEIGVNHTPLCTQSYLSKHLDILDNDPNEIFKAARDADKIKENLLSLIEERDINIDSPLSTDEQFLQENIAEKKTTLNVPEDADRDELKGFGALWDKKEKTWYVPAGTDLSPFQEYLQPSSKEEKPLPEKKQTPQKEVKTENIKESQQITDPNHGKNIFEIIGAKWDKNNKKYIIPVFNQEQLKKYDNYFEKLGAKRNKDGTWKLSAKLLGAKWDGKQQEWNFSKENQLLLFNNLTDKNKPLPTEEKEESQKPVKEEEQAKVQEKTPEPVEEQEQAEVQEKTPEPVEEREEPEIQEEEEVAQPLGLATENTRLYVRYEERKEAKALGAKWDKNEKTWYAPEGTDLVPLQEYLQPKPEPEKIKLNVSIEEKDEAKALGALWSNTEKTWYVPAGTDLTPFHDYLPKEPAQEDTRLYVPFDEKDEAKALGAKWNKDEKYWYAPEGTDLAPLKQWSEPRKETVNVPKLTPQQEFGEFLRSAGLIVDGDPIMDGQYHHVPTHDSRVGTKPGSYRGFLDGHPAGSYTDFRTGVTETWRASMHVVTPEGAKTLGDNFNKNWKNAREERKRIEAEQQAAAIAKADHKWNAAEDASHDHPYLKKKRIPPFIARQDKQGNLMIPGYDANGKISTIAYINDDGQKWYEKNCKKRGSMAIIPSQEALGVEKDVYIVEGFATGVTVHGATVKPVVVAFDAHNLKHVALAVKEQVPDANITICADNDAQSLDDSHNIGVKKALEAAEAIGGCKVVVADHDTERHITDFNDMYIREGLEAVRERVEGRGINLDTHESECER